MDGSVQLQFHSFVRPPPSPSLLAMENNLHAPRRRGRPLGSKNKRKKPMEKPSQGMEQDAAAMQLKVLEIAAGSDVISAVSDFANRYKVDVSLISTHGLVCDLIIHQPWGTPQTSLLFFKGVFRLLSLNGNFYGSLSSSTVPSSFSACRGISFVGCEGCAVGGFVLGKLMAATKVFLEVSITKETKCIKLPTSLPLPLPVPQPVPLCHSEAMLTVTATATAGKPEVSSSARGSITAYGIQYPTPLRQCNCVANGYLSTSGFK